MINDVISIEYVKKSVIDTHICIIAVLKDMFLFKEKKLWIITDQLSEEMGVPWGTLFRNRLGKIGSQGTTPARAGGGLSRAYFRALPWALSSAVSPPALGCSVPLDQATNFSISEKSSPWHPLSSFNSQKENIFENRYKKFLNLYKRTER